MTSSNTTKTLDTKIELATTIAETVLDRPKGVCPHCIDNILKITKTKLEEIKTN